MLVLHQLLYVLFTLHGIFMHFLELTYQQDATVPVPVFYCFSIPDFTKGNILGIGRNKSQSSYFLT
jgi:hypothetical protein